MHQGYVGNPTANLREPTQESTAVTEPGDDPRTAFLRGLPRKLVEIKATLGALIADPRSARMRDELRRRLHALYTLARSYSLPSLAEALKNTIELLDATRSAPQLGTLELDRLALLIASFAGRGERDALADGSIPVPGTEPALARPEIPRTQTLVSMVAPPPPGASLIPTAQHPDATALPLVTTRPVPAIQPGATSPPPAFSQSSQSSQSSAPVAQPLTSSSPPPPATRLTAPPSNVALAGSTSVLFAGSHVRAATLRGLLPADVEILPTVELPDALARARDTAPDVILAEVAPPADGIALLQALRRDPLTDFLPVVLLAPPDESVESIRSRCPDAADVLPDGADSASVRAALERALTGGVALSPAGPDLGELTLDELTRALQDEIRRGLVGAASPRARAARVAMGAGSEVLAATWEAIARIRDVVEKRSGGQVRFDHHASPRGLPGTHVFSLSDDTPNADDLTGEDPLPGRRALVVDDDPTVVTQFAALLRDAGMEVDERTDGADALRTARRARPDVVIADILMPGLDGFALCRAVRRDVALRHTPVILLSWKDDLLVRMRELGAQAQGYLRKEARGESILARVRAVLRSRVRVLRRVAELTAGAEARGRVERVGTFPLLETVAQSLGDATVTVSDSSSVTELDLRGGDLVSAVRTLQDGRVVRGEDALLQALGAATGRFAVRRSTAVVRQNLSGELEAQLGQAARRIAALEESVTGASLLEVARVEADRDGALAYARSLPVPMRAVIERLLASDAPRDMVLRDGMAPGDLEPLLVELARRGVIQRVLGPHGEDLTAMRLAASPDSMAPPDGIRALPPRGAARPSMSAAAVTVPLPTSEAPPEPSLRPDEDALAEPAPGSLADAVWRELRDAVDDGDWTAVLGRAIAPAPPPMREPTPLPVPSVPSLPMPELPPVPSEFPGVTTGEREAVALMKVPRPPATPREMDVVDLRPMESDDQDSSPDTGGTEDPGDRPTLTEPISLNPEPEQSGPGTSLPVERPALPVEPTAFAEAAKTEGEVTLAEVSAEAQAEVSAEVSAGASMKPAAVKPSDAATERPPPRPPEEVLPVASELADMPSVMVDSGIAGARKRSMRPLRSPPPSTLDEARRGGVWPVLFGMLVAGLVSYRAVLWYLQQHPVVAPEQASADAEVIEATPRPAVAPDAATTRAMGADAMVAADATAVTDATTRADVAMAIPGEPYADAAPYLDGGALPSGQGLLVVRAPRHGGSAVEVQVDQRVLGTAPLQQVMAEGLHTVRFRAGIITSYQFATVHPGVAVLVNPPSDN